MDVSITLTNLTENRYLIKEYYVNTEQGSAYDKWLSYGGLAIDEGDRDILAAQSTPGFHQYFCNAKDGSLTYAVQLEPLEIRCAELIPMTLEIGS
jgi:hypothetical protein